MRPKQSTLGAFLEDYFAKRKALMDVGKLKPRTVRNEQRVRDSLVEFFGPNKPLRNINEGDAKDFRNWLLTSGSKPVKRCGPADVVQKRRGLNEPTVQKQCAVASRFLNDACHRDLIHRNPFDSVPKANLATKRRAFISRDRRPKGPGRIARYAMEIIVRARPLGRASRWLGSARTDMGRRGLGTPKNSRAVT